jgi:hypothetical protein
MAMSALVLIGGIQKPYLAHKNWGTSTNAYHKRFLVTYLAGVEAKRASASAIKKVSVLSDSIWQSSTGGCLSRCAYTCIYLL